MESLIRCLVWKEILLKCLCEKDKVREREREEKRITNWFINLQFHAQVPGPTITSEKKPSFIPPPSYLKFPIQILFDTVDSLWKR